MQHVIELVRPYFESWGYLIVFGTTVAENSAFLALVIPGDAIAYVVRRFAGRRRIIQRWGGKRFLPHSRLERFDRYFAEYGMWAVALGRITPVVRAFNTFAAGMSRMPFLRFLAAIVVVLTTTYRRMVKRFEASLESRATSDG